MTRNSENIEAKLAAYIDGNLDAQGRAEIENYLQTNPSHRRLLAELARTHGLLQDLPRETAPPEIVEEFNSQLERSALLGTSGADPDDMIGRINRWPQFLSLAAIVLLTVGLGVVLYLVLLPASQSREFTTADEPRRTWPTTKRDEPVDPLHQLPAESAPDADGPPVAGLYQLNRSLRAPQTQPAPAARPAPDVRSLERQLPPDISSARPNAFALVVHTDDLPATQDQVLAFLSVNGIEFEPITTPTPAPVQRGEPHPDHPAETASDASEPIERRNAPADRDQTPRPEESEPGRQFADHALGASSSAPDASRSDQTLLLARNLTPAQASALARALPQWREGQSAELARIVPPPSADADSRPASPQLVPLDKPIDQFLAEPAPSAVVTSPPTSLPAGARTNEEPTNEAPTTAAPTTAAPADETIGAVERSPDAEPIAPDAAHVADDAAHVAPDADRIAEDTADLSTQSASPSEESAPALVPSTQPVPIAIGDWLTITVHPADEPARAYIVRVDGAGEITLPTLGALPAIDLSPAPLADHLTAAYRESGMILARAVEVQPQATLRDHETVVLGAGGAFGAPAHVDLVIFLVAGTAGGDADVATDVADAAAHPDEPGAAPAPSSIPTTRDATDPVFPGDPAPDGN